MLLFSSFLQLLKMTLFFFWVGIEPNSPQPPSISKAPGIPRLLELWARAHSQAPRAQSQGLLAGHCGGALGPLTRRSRCQRVQIHVEVRVLLSRSLGLALLMATGKGRYVRISPDMSLKVTSVCVPPPRPEPGRGVLRQRDRAEASGPRGADP